MKKLMIAAAAVLASATLATTASADDRPATPEERAEIGSILKANGFTSWRKIEYDHDDRKFEVDDAVSAKGVFDVDIRNGKIIKIDRED
jgi:hypothetical protein